MTSPTAAAISAARRPRTPGLLQLSATAVLAVMLVALALTTRQPPPPAIAEFAPQAVHQIKQAPKNQASQFGSGKGAGNCPPGAKCGAGKGPGNGTGAGGNGGKPPPPPTVGPPGLPCVGNPPRQIEDPQSPPCVSYWHGDNGGATSPGVTATTIKVAAPDEGQYGMYQAWANFFNSRFEFYGRQIQIIDPKNGGGFEQNGAGAADTAKQLGVFAGLTSYSDPPYYRELVKNKIIGIYRTTDFDQAEIRADSPYLWGYTMDFTEIQQNLVDWTCHRLVGTKAFHAGMSDSTHLNQQKRTFSIFLELATADSRLNANILKNGIKRCGGDVKEVYTYQRDNNAARDRTDIAQVKSDGSTTNFCLCVSPNLVSLQSQAEQQNYQPEWVITSYPQLVVGDSYDGPQMNSTFGVSFSPMDRVKQDHPSLWAELGGNPNIQDPNTQTSTIDSNDIHYRGFLLLASGIQMAGPHLTPETFKEGLQHTTFPNPDSPLMMGKVGFQNDWSMTNDGAEFWFSTNSPGPYADDQNGPTFCWVDHGARHALGTWSEASPAEKTDEFYQPVCDSGRQSVS